MPGTPSAYMNFTSSAGLAVAIACAVLPVSAAYTPVIAFVGALVGVLLVLAYFMFHTILRVFEWGDGLIRELRKKKEEGTLWSPFDDVM